MKFRIIAATVMAFIFLSGVTNGVLKEIGPFNWKAYSGWNANFNLLDLSTGEMTPLTCPPGFWHLDFAPDGTLYGLNRATDQLYKITNPQTGQKELLTNLPGNSGGDPIAVSPDGSLIYFTFNLENRHKLYRYNLSNRTTSAISITNLPLLTGMTFGKDGFLYGIDGYNGTSKSLWKIDLQTLHAAAVGPVRFGLNMDLESTATALDVAPDGTFYLAISPIAIDGTPWSEYYISTINPATGIATINYQAPVHMTGSSHYYIDTMAIIPEPATVLLVGLGGLALMRKRRA